MTLVLELPPDIESRVLQAAEAEGLDTSAYVGRKMASLMPFFAAPVSMTNKELVEEINRGFSEAFWERFRALVRLRQSGKMTTSEQEEAIRMTDQTEERAAERLQCLVELSARTGKSVDQLMAEMGIRPVQVD